MPLYLPVTSTSFNAAKAVRSRISGERKRS